MSDKKTFYDNPKKLIIWGLVFAVLGIALPFIWTNTPDFTGGMLFGGGMAYFGLGMHKQYNKE